MDYEEYKGKLCDIKSSLDSFARIKDSEYQKYREFLNNKIEVPMERRQEMIDYLGKMQKEDEENIKNQSAFIEMLLEKVCYKEIVEDVLEKLGIQKTIKDNTTSSVNNVINEKNAKEDWQNKDVIMRKQSQEISSYNTDSSYEKLNSTYQNFMVNNSRYPYLPLSVADEYAEELGNLNYSSWSTYEQKDKVILVETKGQPRYYAYDVCKYTNTVKEGEYYFLVPAKTLGFTEMMMVKAAIMTFFKLSNYNGTVGKPKVIKPACVKKEGDSYIVGEKGILEF
ncbi:hypothetical protein [uncultured Phascolarctobacterium sp.]|uniref:hypothetical protein n=1 Tax=uncultured Phascolarctobacterium sp. TaxID=512296 RepID=UPI0025F4783C|nr:hypothetical protein [uncultured Phascolarctobacterium sp.]